MATKAELEAELAQLRKALSEIKNVTSQEDVQTDTAAAQADSSGLFEEGEFAGLVHQALEDLETLPHRKPVLTALGIFFVGYLFGRSGHRG
ncbi:MULTISPECIES: hypothetical protein [Falsihalocynthiibacter]|uniref:hypothetical protein n=1 Tax=Falsihalocynthiibacter TaxID=2854182 RepID=UPI003001285A